MRRLAILAALPAVTLVAPAQAATWSAPVRVASVPGIAPPSIGFGADGRGLVSWFSAPDRVLASRERDGSFRARGRQRQGVLAPGVYARSRAIYVRVREQRRGTAVDERVSVAFGSTTGARGRERVLATYRPVTLPSLAVDGDGDAIVGWIESVGSGTRLRVAIRRPGGHFGAPATVATGDLHLGSFAVAAGRDGRLAVAWGEDRPGPGGRALRVRIAAGRTFGRPLSAGPQDGVADIALGFDWRRRLVVAWGTQDGGEEASRPYRVLGAILPRGATRFTARQTLDAGGPPERAPGRLVIATPRDRAAVVAWTAVHGARRAPDFPLLASTAGVASFSAPQLLDDAGLASDAAVLPDGSTVLAWAHARTEPAFAWPVQPMAAVKRAGRVGFDPAEPVGPPALAITPPDVAVDPVAGAAVAVWAASDRTPTPDTESPVLSAVRAG